MSLFLHRLKSLIFASKGIWYALRKDSGFKSQIIFGFPIVVAIIYMGWPLSELEWWLVGASYAFILITELQNSAIETALDHIHPEHHESIGHSKDMIAGSVLIAGFVALAVTIKIICF